LDFGLFYEIPVAAPWHERSERDAYHRVIDQAVLGEQVGFSHFWTVEHHFLSEFSHCSAPEVLYGAVAARTKTIRIGHGVRLLPFPYNHPIRAAEMAALLDCVCDGRLEFGTGRSATRDELEGFGIDPNETRGMWEEALDVIVGAWTTDVFSWEGTHFRVPPRRVLPKPLQKPHPPLWMASTSPASHEIAGRKGLGLLSFTIGVPPEELASRIALYRSGLKEARPAGKFINDRAATFTMVHCAETDAEARQNAAESVLWYFRRSIDLIGSLAAWQEGQLRLHAHAARAQPERRHLPAPGRHGRRHRGRPRDLHPEGEALPRGGLRPAPLPDAAVRHRARQGDQVDRAVRAARDSGVSLDPLA